MKKTLASIFGEHRDVRQYRQIDEPTEIGKNQGTILADLKRVERADLLILDDFVWNCTVNRYENANHKIENDFK